MNKNVTYYLGAGASYNALPILNELSEEIQNFLFLSVNSSTQDQIKRTSPSIDNPFEKQDLYNYFTYEFYRLGQISKDFNTVDTYAKMLKANNNLKELSRLKTNLSLFLTLWQLFTNKNIDSRFRKTDGRIDKRYISLIASFIDPKNGVKIPNNINFITWNYDLQLELAFTQFMENEDRLQIANSEFTFMSSKDNNPLQVCHLNGFGGYHPSSTNYLLMDFIKPFNSIPNYFLKNSNSLAEILNSEPDFEETLNFAWEDNESVKNIRNQALEIANNTEELIIIGYSFPIFNRDLDSELFKNMTQSGKLKKIHYQSKDASESFLRDTFDMDVRLMRSPKIIIETENMNQFIIPNK